MSTEEQDALAVLSVFPETFDAETAARIIGSFDPEEDPFDLFERLLQKSLVRRTEISGQTRFALLVPIRDFAQRIRDERRLGPPAFAALSEWVKEIAPEYHFDRFQSADTKVDMAYLEMNYPSVRAVIEQELETGPNVETAGLVSGLWKFWRDTGQALEMLRYYEKVLEIEDLDSATEAGLRMIKVLNRHNFGDQSDRPFRDLQRAEELYRAAGDYYGLLRVTGNRGVLYDRVGDTDNALLYGKRAISLCKELGPPADRVVHGGRNLVAMLVEHGRIKEAREIYESVRGDLESLPKESWQYIDFSMILAELSRMEGNRAGAVETLVACIPGVEAVRAAEAEGGDLNPAQLFAELAEALRSLRSG